MYLFPQSKWAPKAIRRLALMVLFLLVMLIVACSVDPGPLATPVAGARGNVTPTPPPTAEYVLQPEQRFTIVCADHHEMVYGDNGNKATGQPATGIAGYCEQ